MRYTKYKNFVKISVFGDDDALISNSNSVYKVDTTLNNSKRMRFNFNGCLNDVKLSNNARLILESLFIPTITNLSNYINVRIVTSTEDTNVDSGKFNTGNPILITTTLVGTVLDRFMLSFVIIDQDEEETQDPNIAPKVEFKNFGRLGAPIRTPIT